MEDLLIDNDDVGEEYFQAPREIPANVTKIQQKAAERKRRLLELKKPPSQRALDTTPIKSQDTRIGMMYTCPTPDSSEPNATSDPLSDLPTHVYKFHDGSFADNVKFILTTILFLGVVTMIVAVAIYKNPQM